MPGKWKTQKNMERYQGTEEEKEKRKKDFDSLSFTKCNRIKDLSHSLFSPVLPFSFPQAITPLKSFWKHEECFDYCRIVQSNHTLN